jgi:hypothetical protein
LEKIIEQHRDGSLKSKDIPDKSKDIKETEEVTTLLDLGEANAMANKPGSDDDALGQDFDDLLDGMDVNPDRRGNVTPLQSLKGGEDDPDNETSYSDDEIDILNGLSGDESNQSKDKQQSNQSKDNQPLGTEELQPNRPVLTKQGVIDLVSKDAQSLTPGSGWELTKQGYCGLLSGYESPNGQSVNVAIDLAALIIMSAVSETTIKNSLDMQEAANDRLLRQAEEHRALAQKQFTEGMARMQAEQEKTIAEAARIRDEYAQSAKMALISYDSMINKVENNQSSNVVTMQMNCLRKRSEQHAQDLK